MPNKKRTSSYLPFHVDISQHHIEIIVGHSELFPQICDELLVHQILLPQALHRFIIFCNDSNSLSGQLNRKSTI